MSESEKKSKPKETEEERKIRKEKERAERKAKEAAEEGGHHRHSDKKEETEEERKARKEREKKEKKAREKSAEKREETEEERKARKEKERAERKAKEAAEAAGGKKEETEEERKARKEREKKEKKAREKSADKREETEEERKERKERERAERKAREAELEAENTQSPQKPLPERKKSTATDDGAREEKKKHETEEERKERKERERAARKAKEANSSRHDSNVNDESDMIKAIEAENRSALKAAGKDGQDDKSGTQDESDREQRRREREERKNKKKNRSSSKGRDGDSGIVDTANLQRQGYRAQFERDLARATALRRLIDLDDTSAVVVDIGPQTEYDLYIRNFGNSGLSHVSVQAPCEEDMISEEVQAERVKQKVRGAQVPEDLGLYPEKDAQRSAFRLAGGAAGEDGNDDDDDGENNKSKKGAKEIPSVDIALLSSFLTRVFPVVNTIMDENSGITAAAADKKSKGATSFSSSSIHICFDGTRNRKVLKTKFGVSNHQHLAALYGQANERGASADLDRFPSVVLIWNTRDPTTPEHILVSLSNVTCIHWSPSRPHLLYGGTEDGCVCVWDLREPDRNHLQAGRYDRLVFRLPSFSSSWHADNHATPICDVRVAGYNTVVGIRKEEMEQLVSLDTAGQVRFWAVNDKEQATGAISDNDYGLNPFSSVRMYAANLRSWRRTDDGSDDAGAGGAAGSAALHGLSASLTKRATGLDFSPADASHYLIAMADGVQHVSRYGSVAAPAQYGPISHYFETPVVVPSCVQCSQLDSRVFVVGYEDGTLRLYLHNQSAPQLTVAVSPGAIVDLRCSRATKWITWALDDAGTLHLLDHAHQERQTPFLSQSLTSTETGICTCLDCPSEEKVEQRLLALGFERGVVQLHTLDNEKLKTPAGHRDEGWL